MGLYWWQNPAWTPAICYRDVCVYRPTLVASMPRGDGECLLVPGMKTRDINCWTVPSYGSSLPKTGGPRTHTPRQPYPTRIRQRTRDAADAKASRVCSRETGPIHCQSIPKLRAYTTAPIHITAVGRAWNVAIVSRETREIRDDRRGCGLPQVKHPFIPLTGNSLRCAP